MSLRVVGAGVGRTGTMSLKLALEQLLGGRCYHMIEVFNRADDVSLWGEADAGGAPWPKLFADYVAAVDWPAAAYWREISDAYPHAVVLLSTRESAEAWWRSASSTIIPATQRNDSPELAQWRAMVVEPMLARFTSSWADHDAAVAAYEHHNAEVRATIPPERLVEWQPGDGWGPLCEALGVPVPGQPFPHANTTEEFRQMSGLES